MALITCTECGNKVSSVAAACPSCGAPPRGAASNPVGASVAKAASNTLLWYVAGGIGVVGLLIASLSGSDGSHVAVAAARPTHFYAFEKDGLYGYQSALTEQDKQNGIASKPLIMIRYLGMQGEQQHWVQIEAPSQQTEWTCTLPCAYATGQSFNFLGRSGDQNVLAVAPGSILSNIVDDIKADQLKISVQRGR